MDKLILFILLTVIFLMMQAVQIDQSISSEKFFQYKGDLNRSTHDASLMVDSLALAEGKFQIDSAAAYTAFLNSLKRNMNLDNTLKPVGNSHIQGLVRVKKFKVINDDQTFPYVYSDPIYQFNTILTRPGVVAIIEVDYKETFSMVGDIKWYIKSSHELTY